MPHISRLNITRTKSFDKLMSTKWGHRVLAGRAAAFPSFMLGIFIGSLLTRMQYKEEGNMARGLSVAT